MKCKIDNIFLVIFLILSLYFTPHGFAGEKERWPIDLTDPLIAAVDDEDVEEVEKILSTNPEYLKIYSGSHKDSFSMNPLHLAASRGYIEIAKLLLEHGMDVKIVSKSGKTPLHFAIESDNYEMVKLLVERGAQYDIFDKESGAALHACICMENVFERKKCRKNRLMIMQYLLQMGADPNIKGERFSTPLTLAIREREYDAMKLLLEHNADPNAPNIDGYTPLILSIDGGGYDAMKLLLEHGADPNAPYINAMAPNLDEKTPLFYAVHSYEMRYVKTLFQSGANIKYKNPKNGDTILHDIGCGRGYICHKQYWEELLLFLLANGADPNARNFNGDTPLHVAVKEEDDISLLSHLADSSSDIDALNENGELLFA